MTDVLLERTFDTPLTPADVTSLLKDPGRCLERHRVRWCGSFFATDQRRMVCHFQAPDTESARRALRQVGADVSRLWAGTVHDAPTVSPGERMDPNILVERSFSDPVTVGQIQAREDAGAACLQNHRVRFVRTYFSSDGLRMLCVYRAPDAESVRMAQRQAAMPLDRVWAFRTLYPQLVA